MAGKGMREIKQRIKSVTSTEHITSAMKLVSSAKLRRAKEISERTKKYFHFVTNSIEDVFHNTSDIDSIFLGGNGSTGKKCYIIITSCRGLCGSFNSNIIKDAQMLIGDDKENAVLVTIGIKGRDYFKKREYEIIADYPLPTDTISFLDTQKITQPMIDAYRTGEISEVYLVTTSFITSLSQEVKHLKLLPFDIEVEDTEKGKKRSKKQVEYDPSPEAVFNYMVATYFEMIVYGAIAESATCEHAARRIAMENATDNAREIISKLTLNYNRARQAAITQEISEIVSGAEALK